MLSLWFNVKAQISGIPAELPHGSKETSSIAVTAKAISNASCTYYNNLVSISTVKDWFDNRSRVSFYFLLEAGTKLQIGGFTLQALDGAVGVILTSTHDSALLHVVPNNDNVGKLYVTRTWNYTIKYRTGDNDIAGYIEFQGPILPPSVANECYHRAVRRVF